MWAWPPFTSYPALLEQHYIAALRYFTPGYAPPHQLWNYEYFSYSNCFFLDGRPERYPFGTRLFELLLGTTVVALLLLVAAFKRDRDHWLRELSPWILGLAFVWFMVTPLSLPIWELFADLRKIQFPWRSIMVADLATAMLFVIAFETAAVRKRPLASALGSSCHLALRCAAALRCTPASGATTLSEGAGAVSKIRGARCVRCKLAAGYDALEFNMPVWVGDSVPEFRATIASIPNLALPSGGGEARIVRWASRDILLERAPGPRCHPHREAVLLSWLGCPDRGHRSRPSSSRRAQGLALSKCGRQGLIRHPLPPRAALAGARGYGLITCEPARARHPVRCQH